MDLNELLKNVISIDKKIFEVYEEMKINENHGKANDDQINKLKELIGLEEWAYSKIDLNYENLKQILEKLKNIIVDELKITDEIFNCSIKKFNNGTNGLNEWCINQMIFHRIYDYLNKIYYLDSRTDVKILHHISYNGIFQDLGDVSGVYVTDNLPSNYIGMDMSQYLNEVLSDHEFVLALNIDARKRLELEAQTDLNVIFSSLLNMKKIGNKYSLFYNEFMYRDIFMYKSLESRLLQYDFNYMECACHLSDKKQPNINSKRFLEFYRNKLALLKICPILDNLFQYTDKSFLTDDDEKIRNSVFFNVNMELLRTYLGMIKKEEIDSIMSYYEAKYKARINSNNCAKRVYFNISMSEGRTETKKNSSDEQNSKKQ